MQPTLLILAEGMGSGCEGLNQMDAMSPNRQTVLDYCVFDPLIAQVTAYCRALETSANWFGTTYLDEKPFVVSSIRKLIESGECPSLSA